MTTRDARRPEPTEPGQRGVAAAGPPARAVAAGPAAGAGSPVLALQRAAGNRAVLRILGGSPPQRTTGNRAVLRMLGHAAPQRTLQRRRVAGVGDQLDLVVDSTTPDAGAHLEGARRMIRRSWDELPDEDKTAVRAAALHGLTSAQFNALSVGQQLVWWSHAIRKVRPGLADDSVASVYAAWGALSVARQDAVRKRAMEGLTRAQFDALPAADRNLRWADAIRAEWPAMGLGDPLLIDTGPRPGTSDAANLQKLVDNANKIFDRIATGAEDASIGQVFGTANVATARRKYANARTRMNVLHGANKIVTDRSGYNAEVSLGGLTNADQLSVAPDRIDRPDEKKSVVTMIHEAMHAGNGDVTDRGYIHIDPETFKGLKVDEKLTNAAHFEVVPRRILVTDYAFAGETFTPSGAGAPQRTPREQAIRGASETFREAWTLALNLHKLWVGLYRTPAEWNTLELRTRFGGVVAGLKFSDTLPFWSKVMKLTVHERASIAPAAGVAATNPVTIIDVALSEEVTRKLSQCMKAVPKKEADATTFLTAKATAAELAAATTVPAERDLLIKLVLKQLGSITGSTDRDIRAVTRMSTSVDTFADILKRRAPADFPD